MDNKQILNLFNNICNDDLSIEKLNLADPKDNKKFRELVSDLQENQLFTSLIQLLGFDADEFAESLNSIADAALPEQKKIPRPSEKLSTEIGLQIHKLVTEYVDTMIKPYVNKEMSKEVINDAYAGLYEFAAWIYTKEK